MMFILFHLSLNIYIFNFLQFYHHPNYISFSYLLVQFTSVTSDYFATLWTATRQASLSITSSWRLLKLMSIKSVIPSNHLILCHPSFFPPSVFPRIRVFSNESVLHIRWPEYWSFSFNTEAERRG